MNTMEKMCNPCQQSLVIFLVQEKLGNPAFLEQKYV